MKRQLKLGLAVFLVLLTASVIFANACPPSEAFCSVDGQRMLWTGAARTVTGGHMYEFAHGVGQGRHVQWVFCGE